MQGVDTRSSSPISVDKTIRGDEVRALTSGRAGKVLPVAAFPLLREDSVRSSRIRIQLKMQETIHPLMNAVNVTAFAHFVPFTAFDRFKDHGLDAYNRSYQGIAEPSGGGIIPYFPTVAYSRNAPFWRTLGVHWKDGRQINRAYLEAYNTIVNFRRQNRSKHLPIRTATDTTLARAFWKNSDLAHIVPDFDAAKMDGEVELQLTNPQVNVRGIGRVVGGSVTTVANRSVYDLGTETGAVTYPNSASLNQANLVVRSNNFGTPQIFAELATSGIRLSLANLEMAKQTAAFANLREQYNGMSDDYLIDLLMEGIRLPDEALKQPILLDRQSTIFGYSERHAMDGANLDKSVTTGATELTLSMRTPPMNVQGVIMVCVEIAPEQLYERKQDPFLACTNPNNDLPNFMRDFLDPQKVSIVRNEFVDVEHATPNGIFGYAPLNHQWKRSAARIGGRYFRPIPDAFTEDRQRFWSMETLNPTLSDSFYLMPETLPHSVFADMNADPFEVLTLGKLTVVGNTVFGKTLEEDRDHYDKIAAQVDRTRLTGTVSGA